MKKLLFFAFLFYLLILLQESFFAHFFPYLPSFIFIIIFFVNLFEKRESNFGIYLSLVGGFLLDVFSEDFFGFYLLICFLISLFIKIIFKRYFKFNLKL